MTQTVGSIAPTSNLGLRVIRGDPNRPVIEWPANTDRGAVMRHGFPQPGLSDEVNAWRTRNLRNLWRGLWRIKTAKRLDLPTIYGALYLTKIRANGEAVPLGLASLRLVTTVGVGYIVDAFQNIVELEEMKYHGYGTGGTAESAADTALVTELTTQYVVNSQRPTGTTTEGASANIYRTVATLSPDSGGTIAITEHGIFSDVDVAQGVLLDRSLFSAVNLVAGADSLQTTYELTLPSGG
jgi:hypothetical protein